MNRPLALAAALAATSLAASLPARAEFDFSGSARARYEALSGQSRPGFKPDDHLVSTRIILTGEYDAGLLRFGGELYDSRAFGADRNTAFSTSEVNALEPVALYVGLDLEDPWGKGSAFGVQAGRILMNIGSRRLIAADDYRNTTNSSTGLRADARLAGGWSFTGWYVAPQTRLPDDLDSLLDNDIALDEESSDTIMWGGIATSPRKVAGGAVELMYLKFRERDAPGRATRDRNLDTWTVRWVREPAAGRWDYEFEGARQDGRARTGTGATAPLRDVEGWFWHARVGYQWALPWKPRLALDYDWVDGDRGGDRITRYDTLLGNRRADFSPSGLYSQVARANLSSPGLRLELAPSARVDMMATWRIFYLASRVDSFAGTGVRDATGRSGRYAGQQLDARVRWWVVPKQLRFEFDGVLLAKGRFLEQAPNARPGDTRYYSLNLTWFF